jgi:NAD(P) transhydrogenase subunit alpha
VIITTAAIPGKRSPVLVTEAMVKGMKPGAVIVDLAAERGGNCELTRADETVRAHGVTIVGPTNLPSSAPGHASQLYSRNVTNLLRLMVKEGTLTLDLEDEIVRETLLTHDGAVTNARVRDLLGAPALAG